ncbi:hypothetical protein K443DRAFT_15894 [Laccaria amethystina LaAM-08-1]|uniref:Uncharacterized protein n=1 Tax=Laccaria amethystina LaAM-08-1 TaxID=1095629 RepID=A0A0C9WWI3_9AGAR|nr:hypothetical protein K443DRAFT_15894 [Laccaria amethystina LaAM-08-1]
MDKRTGRRSRVFDLRDFHRAREGKPRRSNALDLRKSNVFDLRHISSSQVECIRPASVSSHDAHVLAGRVHSTCEHFHTLY